MVSRGVVLASVGGRYRVFSDGAVVDASLRGRLKQGVKRVLVGDAVALASQPDGSVMIDAVEPRHSLLKRRSPGKGRGERAVVANVDQVVVVGAARQPDWDFHLVDRFAAVAEANDLPLVIVINKCDLTDTVEPFAEPYRRAGYAVLCTSVTARRGLEQWRECLERRVSVLTGSTGVGKSSLLNVLDPGLALRTAEVSTRSRAGRHTTVAAEMLPLGANGFVVDTPGLRDVSLWAFTPPEVQKAFPEIGGRAGQCRFDDCRHLEEPGCAVVAAVQAGDIASSRFASYRRLLREALEAAAQRWT